jgi:hypothetical protein
MTRTRGPGSAISVARAAGGRAPARPRPLAAVTRNAGRQRMSTAVLTVAVTLMVAVGSYTVSARVSAERHEVERLARGNAALAREVHTLGKELRVRMRLPQLQSWNDSTLRLQPASARQLLGGTAELAVYALERPAPAGPVLVAAAPELPAIPPALPPQPAAAPQRRLEPPATDMRASSAPGLVLASVSAVIEAGLAGTPEEGSGLPASETPGALAIPLPVEP